MEPGGESQPSGRAIRVQLAVMEPHACSYLPGRTAQMQGVWAGGVGTAEPAGSGGRGLVDPAVFESFLNAGFRRSGSVIYRPACEGCRACQPLRIDTAVFLPTGSQRRILRRNRDVTVEFGLPALTREKINLYERYLAGQHDRGPEEAESLEEFLYASPVTTAEMTYRDAAGRLLGVGICDITPNILSSVYFFWDPLERSRSLGIFGALREIEMARRQGRRWYHLGYWVPGAPTMDYKASLADHELLLSDGFWAHALRRVPDRSDWTDAAQA